MPFIEYQSAGLLGDPIIKCLLSSGTAKTESKYGYKRLKGKGVYTLCIGGICNYGHSSIEQEELRALQLVQTQCLLILLRRSIPNSSSDLMKDMT